MEKTIEKIIKLDSESKKLDSKLKSLNINKKMHPFNWNTLKNPILILLIITLLISKLIEIPPELGENIFLLPSLFFMFIFLSIKILEVGSLIEVKTNVNKNIKKIGAFINSPFCLSIFFLSTMPLFHKGVFLILVFYVSTFLILNFVAFYLKKTDKNCRNFMSNQYKELDSLKETLKLQKKEIKTLKNQIVKSKKLSILLYNYPPKNPNELKLKRDLVNEIELNYYSKNSVKECLIKDLNERKIENY